MNRWKLLLSWATLFGFMWTTTTALGVAVRQRSVESCGPHPLIALAAASRPFASSSASLNDLIRAVRADPDVWTEMQILLRRYDDCIRAGDGLHYKRSKPLEELSPSMVVVSQQRQQAQNAIPLDYPFPSSFVGGGGGAGNGNPSADF